MAERGWTGTLKRQVKEKIVLAPSIEEITKFLNSGGDEVLTREQIQSRIVAYFLSCTEVIEDPNTGETITRWTKPPAKSELATALGILTNKLADYCNGYYDRGDGSGYHMYGEKAHPSRIIKTEDFDLLRKAVQIIEGFYEGRLANNGNPAGSIYWLNNLKEKTWTNDHEKTIEVRQEPRRTLTLEELPKMAIAGTEQATIPEFDFDDDDEDEGLPLARIGRPQGSIAKRIGDDDEQ